MAQTNTDITAEELKQLLDSETPINLIDVREEHEYEDDNLGGNLLPLGELSDRLEEIENLKDEEIFVHCRSGARSGKAKQILNANGFTNVHNVLGGIMAYRNL